MLYGNKTWCLDQNEIGILQRGVRAIERAMCGVKLVKRKKDLTHMLGLEEAIDQLANANGVQ